VNQFFLQQLAHIARKLDSIQEGPRTLLDNTMLLFCSSMLNGNHDASQLPVVMLGGAEGRLRGGRLYLLMMVKMDVRLPAFGDATRKLEEV
jgi:hypothetical protein